MKKVKAFLIGFIALGLIAGGTLAYLSYHEIWFSVGRCLVTKNNEYMVVFDGGPCIHFQREV